VVFGAIENGYCALLLRNFLESPSDLGNVILMTAFEENLLFGSDDIAFGFTMEDTSIRGQLVRLGPATADEIISRHNLHPIISGLLGELLALVTICGASLKFQGKLIAELRGDIGNSNLPIEFVVAEYLTAGTMRGMAKINQSAFDELLKSDAAPSLNSLFGSGVFLMTIDQGKPSERYQGQIALDGGNLSEIASRYFEQSEQIPTKIMLSCKQEKEGHSHEEWRACGIMVQRIGRGDGREQSDDTWDEVVSKFETLTTEELIDPNIGAAELLFRLYHENNVVSFEPKLLAAKCNCSHKRLVEIMRGFPKADTEEMIENDGQIHARCEYCNSLYKISPKEFRY